jgi:hypothetical protein
MTTTTLNSQSGAEDWAPERIWLQRGIGEGGSHTWCEHRVESDSIGEPLEEVEYVRAAASAQATIVDEADLLSLLPGPYYMDPPDGGSVTVLEQLRRMADDAAKYRAQATDALVDDLSTLVVRLVRALRKASPDSDLPVKALDYLYRKDLSPSVLRGGMSGEFAATPPSNDAREAGGGVPPSRRYEYRDTGPLETGGDDANQA